MSENTSAPSENQTNSKKSALPATIIGIVAVVVVAGAGWMLYSNSMNSDSDSATDTSTVTEPIVLDQEIAQQQDGPAATVNGDTILISDILNRSNQLLAGSVAPDATPTQEQQVQAQQTALQQLVNETLLLQAANAENYTIAQENIDTEFDAIVARFQSREEFDQILQTSNLTEDQVRSDIVRQLTIQGYVDDKINFDGIEVTEEEVQARYDEVAGGDETAPSFEELSEQLESQIRLEKADELVLELLNNLSADADIQVLIGQQQ